MKRKPRIGLALGSGSARGWAHIGAIRALEERGVKPDMICGSSIGALVGAAYASGQLDKLEEWVTGLAWTTVVRLMDLSWSGGLIRGARLFNLFNTILDDVDIDELPVPYGAVATELGSGREVWLRHGKMLDAVRASCAMPGIFRPAVRDGVLLVDGGLVNPVPVSMCRALGADVVIAVDLSWGKLGVYRDRVRDRGSDKDVCLTARWRCRWRRGNAGLAGQARARLAGARRAEDRGPRQDAVDLRGVHHLARHRRDARRAQPPVGRSGRRAAHAAAAGLPHHGLPPRRRRRSRRAAPRSSAWCRSSSR